MTEVHRSEDQQARLELMTDELGELLYEIGWRPTADAQWDNLKANVGRLQAVLKKIEVTS